ncbi:MAG: hypothetical protein K2W91_11710 [Novosphingobium sp.]|nr:hypothetical protein [Novosphingobium sp.]
MGAAIDLRDDFDGVALRRLARLTKSANQARRLLALAQIYDGSSRGDAAKIGGVSHDMRDYAISSAYALLIGPARRKSLSAYFTPPSLAAATIEAARPFSIRPAAAARS